MILALLAFLLLPSSGLAAPCAKPDASSVFQSWSAENKAWQSSGDQICQEGTVESKAAVALAFLRDFPVGPARPDDFDTGHIGDSPFTFFQERIHTIYFDPLSEPQCDSFTVAYVSDAASRSLHICPYANSFSSLVMSSILMHESRHVEGYPHRTCLQGALLGSFSCDDSYAEGGAYGIEQEFLVRTARNEGLGEPVREEAKAEAIAGFLNRFNQAPLGARQGILLLDPAGTLTYFDGATALPLMQNIPPESVVVLRDLPALFEPSTGQVKSFTGGDSLVDTPGPFAAEFRALSAARRAELLDVVYGDISCFLFTQSLHCEQGNESVDLDLPANLQPQQFLRLTDSISQIFFIVGQDGKKYSLPFQLDLNAWKASEIVPSDSVGLAPFRDFTLMPDGRRYALTFDGTLMAYGTSDWAPVPAFAGKKFRHLMAPFLWSGRLGEI